MIKTEKVILKRRDIKLITLISLSLPVAIPLETNQIVNEYVLSKEVYKKHNI